MRIKCVFIAVACMILVCSSADAWYWEPPPQTSYWEAVYGYLAGFTTIEDGDEVGAFRVIDDTLVLVGYSAISETMGNFIYSMFIYGNEENSFDVLFLVWDGSSQLSASPNFLAKPKYKGSGPTSHDLESVVPEPPTALIMGLSLLFLRLFMVKNRFVFCSFKA